MCREDGAHSPQLHRSARSAAGEQGPEEELQQPAGRVGWEAGPVATMTHPSPGLTPLLTQAPRKPLPKFGSPPAGSGPWWQLREAALRGLLQYPQGQVGSDLGWGRTACAGTSASVSSEASQPPPPPRPPPQLPGFPFILGQAPPQPSTEPAQAAPMSRILGFVLGLEFPSQSPWLR
ncbi:hypothetical protein MDA_GLEAN10000459 [Myotis davidii]|uniref:Uncharacterized protein n=1 Tax=Myotis davidii TaxID=225400 RepID=L5MHR1_MYODS|nr:hypothetical protein MDA_GLEAN10000459 [Myotis davidii]